jgi:hypothetical protein
MLTQDSEFDNNGEEEIGEEEEFLSEENDFLAIKQSIVSEEDEAAKLRKASEMEEDERKKREHELIERNLSIFPFFRGVHAEVDLKGRLK